MSRGARMIPAKSAAIVLAAVLFMTVFAGVASASQPGGGGGGTSYYSGTAHFTESGLSSEITEWSTDYAFGSAAPGGTISGTIQWPTTDGTSFSASVSWEAVPGYSTPATVDFTISNGGSVTENGAYSGSPIGPTVSPSASENPADSGQSITLYSGINTNDVNGASYSWSTPQGSFSSSTAANPTFSDTVGSTQVFTISLYASTDAGSTSGSFSMTVNPDPTISISGPSTTGVGLSASFTSSASGGTGSLSYTWYEEVSGGSYSSFSTSANPSYTFSSAGTYYVYATVRDQAGYTVSSNTLTVDVVAPPTVSISSQKNPMDVGQSVSMTSSVSGGSGGGTYTWYDQNGQIGSGSTLSLSSFSAGTYDIYLTYVDSIGQSVTSSTIDETINSDPSASITSSQNPTDVGNTVTFDSSVSGGTSGYTYSWSINGNTYTSQDVSVSFSSSGSYIIDLTVTDAAGYSVSTSLSETINSDPTISATSSVSTADVGYSIEFSSTPSGGTSPYTYSWTIGGTQVSTSQDFSYSFSSAGSYTVEVTVMDSLGETYSTSVSITINNNPSVSVSSSQNPTDVGNSVTFTASESGGTGTISYAWTINGVSVGSGATLDYTFSSSGSYTVTTTVTDSDGHTASASVTEIVYSDPSVSVASSQNPTDVGNTVTFSASPSGGSGSYTYQWYVGGGAVSGATSSTYATSFSSSGTEEIYVVIYDSVGNSAQSSTLDETVNADPSVTVASSQNPTDVGNTVTFTASPTGGTGSFTYQWYVNSAAISGATSSTYSTSFSSSGSPTIYVIVTDSVGNTAQSSTLTQTVNPDPSTSISSSQNPTDIGNTVTFTATASGGTGSYSYAWTVDGATQSSTASEMSTSFSSAATYYVNLTIKDTIGNTASYSFVETVNTDPSVTISSSPNPTDTGIPVTFSSSPTGGTSPYNYTWEINSVVVSYESSFSYTFSSADAYGIQLTLTDANGNTATATLTETVNALPTATISVEYSQVDQGVNDTFTASVSGGTYPYNYTWTVGGAVVNYSSSFHMPFTSTGTNTVYLTVTDSLGKSYSTSIPVTVIQKPSISVNGPDKTDINTVSIFTGNATYGSLPYTFYWYVNGVNETSVSAGLYLSYTFTSAATYNVSIKAVDSQGAAATSYLLVTVYNRPTVSISPSSLVGDIGFIDSFTSSVTGGSSPYIYQWTVDGNQVGSGTNLSYTFASQGTIEVILTVTDFAGNSAKAYDNITVNALPDVGITAANIFIDQGVPDIFNSTVSFGTSPYNYTWEVNGAVAGYGATLSYSFTSAGTYTVSLIVSDKFGKTGSATLSITVNSLPSATFSMLHNTMDSGQSDSFISAIQGGTGPYTYTWEINGAGVSSSRNLTFAFVTTGQFTVSLTITDSLDKSTTYTQSITVNPSLSGTITIQYPVIDENITENITVNAQNGTSPYTYAILINGEKVSSTDSYSEIFLSPGTYTVSVYINDSAGEDVFLTKSIVVRSNPEVYIVTPVNKTDANVPIDFRGVLSNGTGPYTYSWIIGGHTFTNSTLSYAFPSAGPYDVQITVTDAFGREAIASMNVTVFPDPVATLVQPKNIVAAQQTPLAVNISGGIFPFSVAWVFPGGEQYSGTNISYAFNSAGPNTFEVKIQDSSGYTDIQNFTVQVALFVSVASNVTSGFGPLSVQFSSSVLGGSDYAYNWTFSQNSSSLLPNPVYTFPTGNYSVTLSVLSANGATGSRTIHIASLPPPVSLAYSPVVNGTILTSFQFKADPNWDASGPYKMQWSMPNGQSLSGLNVSYAFPIYNEFNIVVATFTYGNNQVFTQDLTVRLYPAPISASFSVPSIIPLGTMLNVSATVIDPDSTHISYSWLYNGVNYSGQNQFFYFGSQGNYSITMTAVDSLGEISTVTHTIDVLPVENNPNVGISYKTAQNGPYVTYMIKVLSSAPISVVEAYLGTQQVTPVYQNDTNGYWYNLTVDQSQYQPGTYVLKIVAFTDSGESNYVTTAFVVSSVFGHSSWVVATFGSIWNFIALIMAIILVFGMLGESEHWHKTKRTEYINYNTPQGTVQFKARRIKGFGRNKNKSGGNTGGTGLT